VRELSRSALIGLVNAAEAYAKARGRSAPGALPPPCYALALELAALHYQQSRDESAERLGRARAPAVAPGGVL
jgi:hypothetical protein